MSRYYGRNGRPISDADAMRLFGANNDARRVRDTRVGDVRVSTVHLVLDHSFGEGPPLIFETMVFGGDNDEYMERYPTEAAALAGHDRIVAALKNGDKLE